MCEDGEDGLAQHHSHRITIIAVCKQMDTTNRTAKNNTTGLKSKVPVFFVFFSMQHMVCLTEVQPEDQGQ